jgi:hypothetical protein
VQRTNGIESEVRKMDDLKVQDLKKRMAAAVNEPDKDKQREMVQEIMDIPEMEQFKELFLKVWDQIKEFVIKCERTVRKYKRTASFKRQHIKHKRWCVN